MSKPTLLVCLVASFLGACGGSSSAVPGVSSSGGAHDGGEPQEGGSNPSGGSDPDARASSEASWSLTGTIRGIDIQEDARSAIAQRIDDGTSVRTSVLLSSLDGYCAQTRANASCPGKGTSQRALVVTISGTKPGTYSVTTGDPLDPPAGEAGVAFLALGKSCEMLAPHLKATTGSVTFSEIDLSGDGKVSLSLDVSTSEGPVSGTISAPTCE